MADEARKKVYLRIATTHPDFVQRLRQAAARRGGNYLPPMRADFAFVLLPVPEEAVTEFPWLAAEITAGRILVLNRLQAQALLATPAWQPRDVCWGPLTKFARGEITRATLVQAIAESLAATQQRDERAAFRAAEEAARLAVAAEEEAQAVLIRAGGVP